MSKSSYFFTSIFRGYKYNFFISNLNELHKKWQNYGYFMGYMGLYGILCEYQEYCPINVAMGHYGDYGSIFHACFEFMKNGDKISYKYLLHFVFDSYETFSVH